MVLSIIFRGLQFVITMLTLRIATEFFSPENFGKISLIVSYCSFFLMFLMGPLYMYVQHHIHGWNSRNLTRPYLLGAVGFSVFGALVSLALLIILNKNDILNVGLSLPILSLITFSLILFNAVNQLSVSALNLLGYSSLYTMLSFFTALLALMLSVSLMYVASTSIQYWMAGLILAQLIVGLFASKLLVNRLPKQKIINNSFSRYKKGLFHFIGFIVPLSIAAGLSWGQFQGFRFLIDRELGLHELGLFMAGYAIGFGLVTGLESILASFFLPKFFTDLENMNKDEAWKVYVKAVLPSVLLTVFVIIMVSTELVELLLNSAFREAVPFVIWGVIIEVLRVFISTFSVIANIQNNTRVLIFPNLIGVCLAWSLSLFLMPIMGVTGVGIALVFAGSVVTLWLGYKFRNFYADFSFLYEPIGIVILMVIVLVVLITLFRFLLDFGFWINIVGLFVLLGPIYVFFQYLLLKNNFRRVNQ